MATDIRVLVAEILVRIPRVLIDVVFAYARPNPSWLRSIHSANSALTCAVTQTHLVVGTSTGAILSYSLVDASKTILYQRFHDFVALGDTLFIADPYRSGLFTCSLVSNEKPRLWCSSRFPLSVAHLPHKMLLLQGLEQTAIRQSTTGEISIWAYPSGTFMRKWSGAIRDVTDISAAGQYLATSHPGVVRLWHPETESLIQSFRIQYDGKIFCTSEIIFYGIQTTGEVRCFCRHTGQSLVAWHEIPSQHRMLPGCVYVTPLGEVYVVDLANDCVQVFLC